MAKGVKKIAYSEDYNEAVIDTLMLIKRIKKITLYPSMHSMLGIPADEFSYFRISEWFPETTQEDKSKPITWLEQNNARNKVLKNSKLISSGRYGLKILKKYAGITPIYLEASLLGQPDKKYNTGLYVFGYCPSKITESIWSINNSGRDVRGSHQFSYGNTVWLALKTEGINGYTKVKIEIYRAKKPGETSSEDQQIAHVFGKVEKGEIHIGISTTRWWTMNPQPRPIENYYVKVVDPQKQNSYISHGNTKTIARFLVLKGENPQPSPYSVMTNTTPVKIGLSGEIFTQVESCRFEEIEIIEPKTSPISIFNEKTLPALKNNTPKYGAKSQVFFFKDSTDYSLEHEAELLAVLQYVMENRLSIKITGYASIDGDEKHNLELAKRRALTLKDFFLSSGIEANTIGISYAIDRLSTDVIARRADISFPFTGHSAQALKYETIAPSSVDKNISINIKGYKTHTCFIDDAGQKLSHKPKKIWSTYSFKKSAEKDTLLLPVRSKLSSLNVAPVFQYLWPSSSSCYRYTEIHIHSCRYYSDITKPTIALYVYPDIKWTLEFSFNFTNPAAYTHANLPEYNSKLDKNVEKIVREEREAQRKATQSGLETHSIKNSPKLLSKFGLKLSAEWDRSSNPSQEVEIGKDFADKLRKVLGVFIKYKEIADKVKTTLGGAAKKAPGKLPFTFEVESPSLNANIEWYLERGTEEYASQIATVGTLNFKADPLIGASFTLDLLALGSRMHPFVAAMIAGTELALSKLKGGILFEAEFYGKLEFDFKALEINSLTGMKGGKLDLGAKFGVKINLKIKFEFKRKTWLMEVEVKLRAEGNANAYFAAKLSVDSDAKGVFAKAELGFSGLIFTFEFEIVVGGFKRMLKFGNEEEPFLKADDIAKSDPIYII